MNKKKILVLIVAIIIGIVGITIATEMNKINAKQIQAKETLQIATQEKNDVPNKNDKIFNFDIITPNSKYINVRNEISNIVLDVVLKDYPSKRNPRAINAVKDIVTEIPDYTLASWTHNGEYSIVKPSSKDVENSRFLHLFNDDRTSLAYFTFNSKDGKVASQTGNIKTLLSISMLNLKESLAYLIATDIMKKYPNYNEVEVKKASLKAIDSFSIADLYVWIDTTNKLNSNLPVTTKQLDKNSLTIPVAINGQKLDMHLSYSAIQSAQGTYTEEFFKGIPQ